MKFKAGDKVVCVNAGGAGEFLERAPLLRKGTIYTVIRDQTNPDSVNVIADDGIERGFFACRFEIVSKPKVKHEDSKTRKSKPVFSGCMMYFPDALLAVAEHSKKANDKHNPGEPLHWSKDKSKDHADCVARHLIDIGPDWTAIDPEFGSYHATALAWRALALLQTIIEREAKNK